MFKHNIFVGVLVFLLIVGSCVGFFVQAQTTSSKRYFDDNKHFSILLPSGWQQKVDYNGAEVVFINPLENSDDKFRESITVKCRKLSQPMNMDECYEMSVAELSRTLKDFKKDSEDVVSISGEEVKYVIYTYQLDKVGLIKGATGNIVKGEEMFTITCTAQESTFDDYGDIFEKTTQSFRSE